MAVGFALACRGATNQSRSLHAPLGRVAGAWLLAGTGLVPVIVTLLSAAKLRDTAACSSYKCVFGRANAQGEYKLQGMG